MQSRKFPNPRRRPTRTRRFLNILPSLLRGAALVAFAGALAGFVACATAPEKGFLPVVIESPASYSEPKGFKEENRVSRLYIRPEHGRWPMIRNAGEGYAFAPEQGVVSWYGYDHIGRRTSEGGWFDPQAMTAAHKTLPFGTLVRVTRLDTGASVEVTINDRGPFVQGRVIDLARKPAGKLGLIDDGIAPCQIEVLKYPLVEMAGPTGNG